MDCQVHKPGNKISRKMAFLDTLCLAPPFSGSPQPHLSTENTLTVSGNDATLAASGRFCLLLGEAFSRGGTVISGQCRHARSTV